MQDIQLTKDMQDFVQDQIASGAYASEADVIRAGLQMLMEDDDAKAFYRLKAELTEAAEAAERGEYVVFDPVAFEPRAFRK